MYSMMKSLVIKNIAMHLQLFIDCVSMAITNGSVPNFIALIAYELSKPLILVILKPPWISVKLLTIV